MLKKKNVRMAVVAAALCGPWLLAGAQEPAKEEAAKPVKEKPAMEALEKMGAYLRTLKTFELSAYSTIDKVLPTGQNVQLDGTVKYTAEVPDKLLVDVNSDRKHRQYFYDGKTVTVYAPRMKYYAVFDAPPTIRETIEKAEAEYDIQLPWSTCSTGEPRRTPPPTSSAPSTSARRRSMGRSANNSPIGKRASIGSCGCGRAISLCLVNWSLPRPVRKVSRNTRRSCPGISNRNWMLRPLPSSQPRTCTRS